MSTAAASTAVRGSRESGRVRVLEVTVISVDFVILGIGIAHGVVPFRQMGLSLLAWTLLVALSQVVPLSNSANLSWSLDLPLLLGAGLVFGPIAAGLMGVVGTVDPREFRGEIRLGRALFNRAQVSLSVMTGVAAFAALGIGLKNWPWTAVAGLVAVGTDMAANYGLVALFWALKDERSILEVLSEMSFGPPGSFVPLYACFGFLGVLIAEAFGQLGFVGVLAFSAPLLLAQQAFRHRQVADDRAKELDNTSRALRAASDSIATERREERLTIAGELHDEVLPPLFQVHLMGQVIKQDLSTGRLLDLDQDVPGLLDAAEAASTVIRGLINNLRRATLGAGGLVETVRAHAKQLEAAGSPRIVLDAQDVAGDELAQLLAYQVAREAMNNAARHSRASSIEVTLAQGEDMLLVTVADDGTGFDGREVDESAHFGLQLMSERVKSVGGSLILDSRLGLGTRVHAAIPIECAE